MRLHRLKRKLATKAKYSANTEQIESEYVYKTPQSLGKAVKKVSRQLPSSPRKRKAVISKIVETTKLTFNKPKDPNGNNQIPATTIEEVKEFYFRDSISVGAHAFDWPKRDDVDSPHTSCIFFDPVQLLGNGPFQVPWQSVIEKVFKA